MIVRSFIPVCRTCRNDPVSPAPDCIDNCDQDVIAPPDGLPAVLTTVGRRNFDEWLVENLDGIHKVNPVLLEIGQSLVRIPFEQQGGGLADSRLLLAPTRHFNILPIACGSITYFSRRAQIVSAPQHAMISVGGHIVRVYTICPVGCQGSRVSTT